MSRKTAEAVGNLLDLLGCDCEVNGHTGRLIDDRGETIAGWQSEEELYGLLKAVELVEAGIGLVR